MAEAIRHDAADAAAAMAVAAAEIPETMREVPSIIKHIRDEQIDKIERIITLMTRIKPGPLLDRVLKILHSKEKMAVVFERSFARLKGEESRVWTADSRAVASGVLAAALAVKKGTTAAAAPAATTAAAPVKKGTAAAAPVKKGTAAAAAPAPAAATPVKKGTAAAAPAPAPAAAVAAVAAPAPDAIVPLIDYEKKLAYSEWIHDWWGGFRNKPGGLEVNVMILNALYAATDIPEESFAHIADEKDRNREISKAASELMTTLYENRNITVSSVEESTISAFEDTVPYLSRPCADAVITYDELFDMPTDATREERIRDLRNQFRSITLNPVNYTVKNLTLDQKIIIRKAIKLFMSGDLEAGFYLTFDAAGKDITKIFLGDDHTQGLIMPANIADSATSSLKKIGRDENVYFFPPNTMAGVSGVISDRNTLTKEDYRIMLVNNSFSPLTPFAFDYVIQHKNPAGVYREISRASFGKKITQGPSLDTLMQNHIDAAADDDRDFRDVYSSGCLDIAPTFTEESVAIVKADVKIGKSIFQSVKMCGDGDQVDEAALAEAALPAGIVIIFITADRQAALTRRLKKKAAILHYGGTFTLYRTDEGLSAAAIAAYNAEKAKKFVKYNIELFNNIYDTGPSGIITKLVAFKTEFPNIPNARFEHIVREIYNMRITDIHIYLNNIADILSKLPDLPEIDTRDEIDAHIANETIIKDTYLLFEQAGIPITTLIYLDKFSIPVAAAAAAAAGGAGGPGARPAVPQTHHYPFLNFSIDDYDTLNSQLRAGKSTMSLTKDVRIPEDFYSHLTQKDGYVSTINLISESFFDKTIAAETFRALDLPPPNAAHQSTIKTFIDDDIEYSKLPTLEKSTGKPAHNIKRNAANIASNALRTQLSGYFNSRVFAAPPAGGYRVQRGGARPTADVFTAVLEILKDASNFFNQRNVDIDRDVIIKANAAGKITVTSVKTAAAGRIPFSELVNSISPSDAATVAGNLLTRMNELPSGDDTIDFIKLLLNPVDDETGYINKAHPLAQEPFFGYCSIKNAVVPSDYAVVKTETGVVPRQRTTEEYSVYYDVFHDIAAEIYTKDTAEPKRTYTQLLDIGDFSEYFKAAYYAQIDGLICLAFLNDWHENNLRENKSLFWNYIEGIHPAAPVNIWDRWDECTNILENIFAAVILGNISRVTLALLRGGNRKTKKRRGTHRKVRSNNNQKTHKNISKRTRRTIRKNKL